MQTVSVAAAAGLLVFLGWSTSNRAPAKPAAPAQPIPARTSVKPAQEPASTTPARPIASDVGADAQIRAILDSAVRTAKLPAMSAAVIRDGIGQRLGVHLPQRIEHRVLVVGAGSVGSHAAEMLVRSGNLHYGNAHEHVIVLAPHRTHVHLQVLVAAEPSPAFPELVRSGKGLMWRFKLGEPVDAAAVQRLAAVLFSMVSAGRG